MTTGLKTSQDPCSSQSGRKAHRLPLCPPHHLGHSPSLIKPILFSLQSGGVGWSWVLRIQRETQQGPCPPEADRHPGGCGVGSAGGQGRLAGGRNYVRKGEGPPGGRSGLNEAGGRTQQGGHLRISPLPHLRGPGCSRSDALCSHGTNPQQSCKVTRIC